MRNSPGSPRGWMVVFGEIEGLRCVVTHSKMAFGAGFESRGRVTLGTVFDLCVTRGVFHNPTRDHS